MNGKSSDGGYMSVEQAIVQVRATVMLYDDASRQWIYSNSYTSPSKVHIYQHMTNNSFRVVGKSTENRDVTINCLISRNLRYNQATTTFHQWRDSRQIYGLQFLCKEDADCFANAMIASLELLNMGADYQLHSHHQLQQDHHHQQQQQQQSQYSNLQQQQQQTTTQRYRHDQQYAGREQPAVEEDGQPDITQTRSEAYSPHHHHQQQQQPEVQSPPPSWSQTLPATTAARVRPPSLSKPLHSARASASSETNNSTAGLSATSNAPTPASACPPPPPPPLPPAAPSATKPPTKRTEDDLASALKGVKLRETTKSAENELKAAKTSDFQSVTLGRASKAPPVFPLGSGTASVGRASGGPPPATRPKLNVMSEMERKLKERKEKSEGRTIATEQEMPKSGTAGLQDLFQGNQSQQRTGSVMAAAYEEETPLPSLSSAENSVAVQSAPEIKVTPEGAVMSAISSRGNGACSIPPAELEALKVELVAKIKQELENTKQEIINAIRSELKKQCSESQRGQS